MTQADSVHSTPRRTTSKNRVQKVAKAAAIVEKLNLRHGEAFRNLEASILQVHCMAEITADAAFGLSPGAKNEIVHFAVSHLCEMVRDLRTKYRADLHAGKAVA
jgi:hypothetical protein